MKTGASQSILVFATSPLTRRCVGMPSRQVECTFTNTPTMPGCQWMSCVAWWGMREKPSPKVSCTTLPAFVALNSTGSSSAAGSLPWWTPLDCQLCSSHIVQLTTSGLNLLISSHLRIQTLAPAAPEPSLRTLPSVTGSSPTTSKSSSRYSTLTSWEPLTSGSGLSGSTAAALMSMG